MSENAFDPHTPQGAPGREPMFNAPWPAVAVTAAIIVTFALQGRLADGGLSLALVPHKVATGELAGLFTSLFLHGGWAHALMNAAFALAFGTPVARLFGSGAQGVAAFFIFYLLCGGLAGLAFVAFHAGSGDIVVGASGAVSGLMGGAIRLLNDDKRLSSPFSSQALTMGGAYVIVNLLMAATGLTPGANGAAIAWEAHLGGFLAGLLLIGPFDRLLRR
jgi:membrane associated rhomboid family serine protease